MDNENTKWEIIDSYFRDDPHNLVRHHIDQYDQFFQQDIFQILREMPPIEVVSKYDEKTKDFKSKCKLYRGGKTGKLVYFEKAAPEFPNEARLFRKTYECNVYYDIEVELLNILEKNESPIDFERKPTEDDDEEDERVDMFKNPKRDRQFLENIVQRKGKEHVDNDNMSGGGADASKKRQLTVNESVELNKRFQESINQQTGDQIHKFVLKRVFLGRFPIMLFSGLCSLAPLPPEMRYNLGECRNDLGGYFIIDGQECVITPKIESCKNAVRFVSDDCVEICSVSENYAKPASTIRLERQKSDGSFAVTIPHVNKPVPLFILFRALGLVSDKEIIQSCLFDLSKHEDILDDFIPSVYAGAKIMAQTDAVAYIADCTEEKSAAFALMLLSDYLLPHMGTTNYAAKSFFLGYMVKTLLYKLKQEEEKRVGNPFVQVFSKFCEKQCREVSSRSKMFCTESRRHTKTV